MNTLNSANYRFFGFFTYTFITSNWIIFVNVLNITTLWFIDSQHNITTLWFIDSQMLYSKSEERLGKSPRLHTISKISRRGGGVIGGWSHWTKAWTTKHGSSSMAYCRKPSAWRSCRYLHENNNNTLYPTIWFTSKGTLLFVSLWSWQPRLQNNCHFLSPIQ